MDTHLVFHENLRVLVTTFLNDILAHSQRQQPSAAVPFYDRTIGLQLTSQSSSALRILHEDIATLHQSPLEHVSQRSGTEDAPAEKQTVRLHSSESNNTEAVIQSIEPWNLERHGRTPSKNNSVRSERADADADDASSSDSSVVITHTTNPRVAAANKSRGSQVPSRRDESVSGDKQAEKEANSASHPKAKTTGTIATSQTKHRSFRDAPPLSPSIDPSPSSITKRATAADFFTLPSTPEPGEPTPRSRAFTTEAIAALLEEEKSKQGRSRKRGKSPEARPPLHNDQEEKNIPPTASNGLAARTIDPRAEIERYSVPADRRSVKKAKLISSEEAKRGASSDARPVADLPIARRDHCPETLKNITETRAPHQNLAGKPTSGGKDEASLQSPHHHHTDYPLHTRSQQYPNTKAVAPMPPSTNNPERNPCTEPWRAVKKAPRYPRVLGSGSSYRPRYEL